MAPKVRSLEERFWEKVDKSGECWLWTAGKDADGYGQITAPRRPRRMLRAHRLSYEMAYGSIPDGMFVLHRCDTPSCVRPEHLFVGDAKTNADDMMAKGRYVNHNAVKTHCKNGHEFTDENTYTNRPGRQCKRCTREFAASKRVP